jgi:hypothetical protein
MLTSPLWVGGEIFLGFSLTIFVGTLIAVFGDQIQAGRSKPAYAAAALMLPNTGSDYPLRRNFAVLRGSSGRRDY